MTMEWLNQHFDEVDNFPRPNWESIYSHVENHLKDADQHELWCEIARTWMIRLKSALPTEYAIHESENFILVASVSDKYVSVFQNYLERILKKILKTLQGVASDNGFGKYVVLIFNDIDTYYSYLSYYYSDDGVYGLSTGVYLNKGYGHFALPHQDASYAESIAAHEMTHALVAHLPIPAWLNEGMAVNIENMFTGSAPLKMDDELYARHKAFWGESEIQEFWSGDSFNRPDEGQELSYHLAQFAVTSLSKDYEAFIEFTNKAHFSDGGEAAASEVYGGSLGNLIAQFFGEGVWAPNPESWVEAHSNNAAQTDAAKLRGWP